MLDIGQQVPLLGRNEKGPDRSQALDLDADFWCRWEEL